MNTDTATMIRREFPDFDVATLPEIPEGFECTAWRNDTCPTWHEGQSGDEATAGMLMLAIDYPEASQREYPECKRFTLQMYDTDASPDLFVQSDRWDDVLAVIRFVHHVRDLGLAFHADTRGSEYVDHEGNKVLSSEQANQYDEDIDAAIDVLGDLYEPTIRIWRALRLIGPEEG